MHVSIYLTAGKLDFEHFDEASALDLAEELESGDRQFHTFEMDDATVIVNRDHIVRVDLEP